MQEHCLTTSVKVLVCGAGGFIGSSLVSSLKQKGYYVIGADLKRSEFRINEADEFYICDLRDQSQVEQLITADIDSIYQLAADMGGAGYIFTGDNDADIMYNSVQINLNILNEMVKKNIKKVFYSSSACMYPGHNQLDPDNPNCEESSAYPANPDSEYGWEKLFSERLYMAYSRNYNIRVRIARFHNVFGPFGVWQGGKEKAPAALCRKVAEVPDGGNIEVWGDGNQTRSFLYIDDCIDGIHHIMAGEYDKPLNLGSDRLISINELIQLIAAVAKKQINIINIPGPTGVRGRNSHNKLIKEVIFWAPPDNLAYGLTELYNWIKKELGKNE